MLFSRFIKDCKGMGTIEVVIIIAVLVALALIFKEFIIDLAKDIFSKIEQNAGSAVSGL
ncbi:MAG: hypothetical protein E7388_08080 [Ruminococcaceae bacterium]|nr:hypothetical protein [Oscillospiraceae bacterium]